MLKKARATDWIPWALAMLLALLCASALSAPALAGPFYTSVVSVTPLDEPGRLPQDVYGFVFDASGEPVDHMELRVSSGGWEATTKTKKGAFYFNLTAGDFTITLAGVDCYPAAVHVDGTTRIEVTFRERGGSLAPEETPSAPTATPTPTAPPTPEVTPTPLSTLVPTGVYATLTPQAEATLGPVRPAAETGGSAGRGPAAENAGDDAGERLGGWLRTFGWGAGIAAGVGIFAVLGILIRLRR